MSRFALAALLLFASAGPAAAQGPARIEIDLSNFKFTPSTITLHHGQSYVLHFVNKASGGHDFVSKSFFKAATIAAGDRAAVAKGEIELDGGETADVRLTAPAPGTYEAHCSHFMHSTFGMTGSIVVD
ncbi:MAG: copper binding s, plastocyanin/azurin family protein [Sphingomonas bacterium]|uniref:cupredoxin domain-containing protein n=1 Tax=Sphingomonas bacterium TaxID=1895847 RepID=UPI0026084CC9|nr:cupredoxin domain-containing protein [Sphingomonas bacterium]MDB5704779.1 copper binding s, plastocyanin/azurin family protein [Sphingomonas bacterium]